MISLYETSDNISDLNEEKPGISAFKFIVMSVQFFIFGGLLLFFFGVGAFVVMGYTMHIDYPNNCYIKIEKDILKGNRDSIFKALTSIKNTNLQGYQDICSYVDTITEASCLLGESRNGKLHPINTDGCYLKGTKTIFLRPDASSLDAAVTLRKEQILKYSQMSKEYWTTGSVNK
jgi:hypothetical protein